MIPPAGTPRVGWYGDDFTGATDTLAVLTQAGLRSMLFLGVPDAARRAAAAQALGGALDAVGIAGASRSMAPDAMAAELAPVGAFFAGLQVPLLHYKVCSTFDSAPGIGSIGAAVRSLRPYMPHPLVAIVAGQPSLGRYCAFSHLFAADGRDGTVERIDRHPTMRRHPVTPMVESDLRRHLALQGLEPVAGLHYPLYREPAAAQDTALRAALAGHCAAALLDVADEAHLAPVGRLLWQEAKRQPLLAVGPSSVAQALVAHWKSSGGASDAGPGSAPLESASAPVFVFAGSLSPVTARQVEAARSFEHVPLSASELLDATAATQAAGRIAQALAAGRHVLASTAPPAGTHADTARAGEMAAAGARLLAAVLQRQARDGRPLRRVGIAGGDTSSLAVQALGLWGLSLRGTLGAGVAVSRTHSEDAAFDGIELMLKGGQMGAADVFQQLLGRHTH